MRDHVDQQGLDACQRRLDVRVELLLLLINLDLLTVALLLFLHAGADVLIHGILLCDRRREYAPSRSAYLRNSFWISRILPRKKRVPSTPKSAICLSSPKPTTIRASLSIARKTKPILDVTYLVLSDTADLLGWECPTPQAKQNQALES
jgi:hypothetical protein